MRLHDFIMTDFKFFEETLQQSVKSVQQERLKLAMEYSLMNGGKRVRPLLLLATLKALGKPMSTGVFCAMALEYIHTYSLIHDDLPAMDNDDFRRGKLTNHRQFDEATAILAGDSLQTMAFELICQTSTTPIIALNLVSALASCAGPNGMIAGQMADIQAENKTLSLSAVMAIHQQKTARLLWFAMYAATQLAQVNSELAKLLLGFAEAFGLAFQIHNDLKDIVQDEKLQKSTYVSLLGSEQAKVKLDQEIDKATQFILQAKLIAKDLDEQILLDFLDYVKVV